MSSTSAPVTRSRRRRTLAIVSGALATAVPVVVIALLIGGRGPTPEERRAVIAYNDAVVPHAEEGGRIVVLGMQPGQRDLDAGRVTPEAFREQAEAWRRGLERARLAFAQVPAPARLATAAKLFDESLGLYLEAVDAFLAASFETGPDRAAALESARQIARRADRTFDRAKALLKAELRRVGAGDVPSL